MCLHVRHFGTNVNLCLAVQLQQILQCISQVSPVLFVNNYSPAMYTICILWVTLGSKSQMVEYNSSSKIDDQSVDISQIIRHVSKGMLTQ